MLRKKTYFFQDRIQRGHNVLPAATFCEFLVRFDAGGTATSVFLPLDARIVMLSSALAASSDAYLNTNASCATQSPPMTELDEGTPEGRAQCSGPDFLPRILFLETFGHDSRTKRRCTLNAARHRGPRDRRMSRGIFKRSTQPPLDEPGKCGAP